MIKNYFRLAIRNMRKNKANSFINIAGLAIGMASVVFIVLYVQDELKYDRFFTKADHIFQVNVNGNMDGSEFTTGNTPPTAGPALVKEFPEIESYARIFRPGDVVVRYEDNSKAANYFTEQALWAADSNFLQVFSYPLLEGNAATCLQLPNSIVITETTAKKYFNNDPAIGKILLLGNDRQPFTVTAVLRDLPRQSSFQFDMLTPIAAYPVVKRFSWSWVWLQVNTYVKLRDNTAIDESSMKKLEAKIPSMVRQQAASAFRRIGQPLDELEKKGGKWTLLLQPMTSVHLYSADIPSRLATIGNIQYVYIFSSVAFFMIILACVNFMNLSTAQAGRRAKEVGIRKVLGSVQYQLIRQFLAEALLYSGLATIVGLILVGIFLPFFNQVSGKSFTLADIYTGPLLFIIPAMTLITGLLAGSYPAFYLASIKPVTVLKGLKIFSSNWSNLLIRNGLVVFQFTVSTALIICTIVVFNQLHYTRTRNLGMTKDNVLIISNTKRLGSGEASFREEIAKLPGISSASITSSVPTRNIFTDRYVPEQSGTSEQVVQDIMLSSYMVDYDFVSTLKLSLLQGRDFSRDYADSASVIINETAARQIGWKEPLGKYMEYPGGNNQRFKVIGVVKDFNIESLRSIVQPFALFHSSSKTYDLSASYILASIKPSDISGTLKRVQNKWKDFTPSTPFDYSFLDSDFNTLYQADARMGNLFTIFTMLSIFVACLGLFGLAAYTAERRVKEIGVRKVLGASIQNLALLLSKDFIKLVLIATVVAFPLAWWSMSKWLNDFAYRIDISWWMFMVAGLAAVFIALATVSFHAVRAALSNPIKNLRTE